jgi:hypothetical protein
MPGGVPIDRQWIYVLLDGRTVLDWGNGLVQDLVNGDFITYSKETFSHPIQDDDLEMLKRAGRIERFDDRQVYVYSLPERPQPTLE